MRTARLGGTLARKTSRQQREPGQLRSHFHSFYCLVLYGLVPLSTLPHREHQLRKKLLKLQTKAKFACVPRVSILGSLLSRHATLTRKSLVATGAAFTAALSGGCEMAPETPGPLLDKRRPPELPGALTLSPAPAERTAAAAAPARAGTACLRRYSPKNAKTTTPSTKPNPRSSAPKRK